MPEAAVQAIGLIGGRWASFVCGTTGLLTPRLPADRRVYPAPNAFATAPFMTTVVVRTPPQRRGWIGPLFTYAGVRGHRGPVAGERSAPGSLPSRADSQPHKGVVRVTPSLYGVR